MELPPISSEENLAEISKFRKQSSCCAEQAQCHMWNSLGLWGKFGAIRRRGLPMIRLHAGRIHSPGAIDCAPVCG